MSKCASQLACMRSNRKRCTEWWRQWGWGRQKKTTTVTRDECRMTTIIMRIIMTMMAMEKISNKDHNIQSGEQQENVIWSFNNINIAQQKSHHYRPPMFEWVWIWPASVAREIAAKILHKTVHQKPSSSNSYASSNLESNPFAAEGNWSCSTERFSQSI